MFADSLQPSAHLLLVDTLARSKEVNRAYRRGYIAKYRAAFKYEQQLLDRGTVLDSNSPISDMSSSVAASSTFSVPKPKNPLPQVRLR